MTERPTPRKRVYVDPPMGERCEYDIHLKGDGADVRVPCGRRKKVGRYCRQHAAMSAPSQPEPDPK